MRRVWVIGVLMGCQEQDFRGTQGRSIAVVTGDFDDVAEPLDRLLLDHTPYDGIISNAVWDPAYDSASAQLTIEGLFADSGELGQHGWLFVASGARGLGGTVYNGVAPDNQLVDNPAVQGRIVDYVNRGNTLVVTDWAYDLVEACWPDAVDFLGDDTTRDEAQLGEVETVIADVTDDRLEETTGNTQLSIHYNFSNWAVIRGISSDVDVWLRGDVHWRTPSDGSVQRLVDAPLLVSFTPEGGTGRVVVATFHLDAQNDPVADEITNTVFGPFFVVSEEDP
jgi:hypothetical protein